ncbi:MAG: SDR family oxidoreductase [Gemmatimonadetes bacterium]|nr:SDR family oxidoreductase [Gemmatimonadota bacterium]
MGKLDGKVAIVTGGGSGIGKGIARAFAQEGCSVVISGRNAERLAAAAEELAAIGPDIVPVPTDVRKEEEVQALFEKTMARFGRLDILVNNAGAFGGGSIDKLSLETWNQVLETCVTGTFLCTREAFRIMKGAGGGRIINIGSISAQMPRHHSSAYATAKFAVSGLTKSTALDGREFGIAASVLHPGNTLVERRAAAGTRSTAGRDEGEEPMVSVETMAQGALLMATLPPEANLYEAIMLPVTQLYLGRG